MPSTYAHLFDEAAGAERVSAADEIRQSFAKSDVPDSYQMSRPRSPFRKTKDLQILQSRRPDSNRGPLHYE
jgi:hypothetical protein